MDMPLEHQGKPPWHELFVSVWLKAELKMPIGNLGCGSHEPLGESFEGRGLDGLNKGNDAKIVFRANALVVTFPTLLD